VHGVVAASLFAGAVALATYIPGARDLSKDNMFASTFARVVSASEATCVSLWRGTGGWEGGWL